MFESLRISQIGLQAQKAQLDAVAQNLANANTPGYKRIGVDFGALMAPSPAASNEDAPRPAAPWRIDLTTGELRATGNPLDLAVSGDGFIEVAAEGQRTVLWRGGRLQVLPDGTLATDSGHALRADIRVPEGARELAVLPDGTVVARLPGAEALSEIGRIELASITDPSALEYLGDGLFAVASDSRLLRGRPGELGLGHVIAGKLESANVKLVDETVNMMLAQRIYELNAKVAQAADEIMALTNGLRK
ncbi:flagellar hook-basal body protein [Niveibacterium sp. COAC-50]|uniref:flagellar hook-basal body protein n=1 Tax=Niveibacterium sp. COAC-50 TaxID=2729384 RepID=UPI001555B77E|nr:flagellar hook basal-body protein [Niveibacterium sp. COAC-50]